MAFAMDNTDGFAKRTDAEITPKPCSPKECSKYLEGEWKNVTQDRASDWKPSFKDKFQIDEPS